MELEERKETQSQKVETLAVELEKNGESGGAGSE